MPQWDVINKNQHIDFQNRYNERKNNKHTQTTVTIAHCNLDTNNDDDNNN